jgi:CBS domain-containing protein
VMTSPVVTVTPDTSIPEAIRLMMAHKIKRLPVVDAGGQLVGLVGRAGVLAAVSHRHDHQKERPDERASR